MCSSADHGLILSRNGDKSPCACAVASNARHTPSRAGDVPHTLADIGKAKRLMDYTPLVDFDEGLRRTVDFFKR